VADTLGLPDPTYSRNARYRPRVTLQIQDEHVSLVGHAAPVALPSVVILAGALAKLNLLEGRSLRVELVHGPACGLLF